jgi:hypothetical protein
MPGFYPWRSPFTSRVCKAQTVDCIVTDFTLPDMSSFELLPDVNPLKAFRRGYDYPYAVCHFYSYRPCSTEWGSGLLNETVDSGEDLTNVIQNAITSKATTS